MTQWKKNDWSFFARCQKKKRVTSYENKKPGRSQTKTRLNKKKLDTL